MRSLLASNEELSKEKCKLQTTINELKEERAKLRAINGKNERIAKIDTELVADNPKTKKPEMQLRFLNDQEKIKTFVQMKPSRSPECFNWSCDSTGRVLKLFSDDESLTNQYVFDHVFGPYDDNKSVFNSILPLLKSSMEGHNVCLIAYGASGSGKTHTMVRVFIYVFL